MSVLRRKCVACVPVVEPPVHEFKMSRSVDEIIPVFNKDGVKVRTYKQKKVVYDSIPIEQWENKGVSSELFRLDNQVENGVNVQEFHGNFIALDLDVSSSLGDKFIDSVNAYVAENAKNEGNNQTNND